LTLEDVYAIKITDYDAITAAGIDRADVARELIGAYLKQFFEDGFFHADPHPGNLFVTPFSQPIEAGKPAWRLTFVDFGMAGRVPGNLRSGLRELLIAVGMRDPDRLVGAYQKLDILLPGADLELLKKAEAQVFERFWGKSMSELRQISFAEMHEFAKEFRELLFDMPFQLPNNLLMMGRAVAILSGMATGLNPDFNLWEQLAPYAQQLVAEEAGSSWQIWLAELGEMVRGLIALPSQTGRVLGLMEQGAISVQVPQISKQIASLEKSVNRLSGSLVFSVFLISSVLLLNAGNEQFAAISLAAAVIALLWLFLF